MKQLKMTRVECASQIDRVASNLRYYIDESTERHESDGRDPNEELTLEIDIQQCLATLAQLVKIMDDLT